MEHIEKENLSKSGQEITRDTTCPCFEGRKSMFAIEPICWFCRYAGFDLNDDKLLVECDRDIMTLGFNNPLSAASGGRSFVITVAGGTSQTS